MTYEFENRGEFALMYRKYASAKSYEEKSADLGRPLGHLLVSLMALVRHPIYTNIF